MRNNLAEEIRRRLPSREVFETYGFRVDRNGFIQCPFHQGDRHGSLKVYDGDRGWHCFGCGAGGSVIDFAMRLFDLDFKGACLRLNEDFRLGLSDRKPTRAEMSAVLKAREEEAAKKEAADAEYKRVAAEFRRWWSIKQQYEPEPGSDYIHPFYAEAVKKLPALESWLDEHMGV